MQTTNKMITFQKLTRFNSWAYAENGNIKTYSNKTQAYKKASELNAAGSDVTVSISHPFLIVPNK